MEKSIHLPTDGCITCGSKLCTKKVSLFSNLNEYQLNAINSLIDRKHYQKGDIILNYGDDFDRLYIVNHGSLKAVSYNQEGKEQILYILNDGDSIGELSLLKKAKSQYDLIVLEESYICTIPKYRFDEFIRNNHEVVFAVLESTCDKITSLEKLVGAVASNDVDTRLKFLINQLIKQSGEKTQEGIIINLELRREDMANFVGVTRETISRKLSKLADEGIIKILKNKKLFIINEKYFEIY